MTYGIDLSGHRALVTGGGQGVGEEIALTLARAGAHVLVNDLVLERAERVPRVDTLVKLAGSLGISPEELLDGISWSPGETRLGRFTEGGG